MNDSKSEHIPVLADTLTERINLPPDGVMVDATIGQGGHSLLFGQCLSNKGVIIGLDMDENAISSAKSNLKELACKVILIQSNFAQISSRLAQNGLEKADFILADLGFCSAQLADTTMGLSFQQDMPLDMRFDKRLKRTAADIVNEEDEKILADLIYKFGEDRASRRIARFIAQARQKQRITTTSQLATIVCRALARPGKKRRYRIHPATRTFQALRIAVNDELENLKALLSSAPAILKKDGHLAIISFHSLEDRLVKNDFKQNEKEDIYKIITKRPIVPSEKEINENRRARSSKLRIAQKKRTG